MRLRLYNDYDVIVAGVRAMLEPFSDRVVVVEEDVQSTSDSLVEVTLYDTFGSGQADQDDIAAVLDDPRAGAVVVYSWNVQPALVRAALDRGCRGYLDKRLATADVVAALVHVADGDVVAREVRGDGAVDIDPPEADWPGRAAGLSAREAEVVALIAQGMTNDDIARRTYISMNSLKTYIRSAYRKIGVERRSQAVRWGIENGMLPQRGRD